MIHCSPNLILFSCNLLSFRIWSVGLFISIATSLKCNLLFIYQLSLHPLLSYRGDLNVDFGANLTTSLFFPNIKSTVLQCPVEAITMGSPAGRGSWEMALGPAHLSQSAPLFHGESITWDLARRHSLTQVIFSQGRKLSRVRTWDFTHKSDLKGKVISSWIDRFTSSCAFYSMIVWT